MSPWRVIAVDVLVLGSAAAMSLVVVGLFRIPHAYAKLHAAAQGVILGVLTTLLATAFVGNGRLITRALLVGVFLLLTTSVSSHALARLERLTKSPLPNPKSIDRRPDQG